MSKMTTNRDDTVSFDTPASKIRASYFEDKATLVRRDLRSMSRREVAEKHFPDAKNPLSKLSVFCRRNQIPYPKALPTTRYWANSKLVESISVVDGTPKMLRGGR